MKVVLFVLLCLFLSAGTRACCRALLVEEQEPVDQIELELTYVVDPDC